MVRVFKKPSKDERKFEKALNKALKDPENEGELVSMVAMKVLNRKFWYKSIYWRHGVMLNVYNALAKMERGSNNGEFTKQNA